MHDICCDDDLFGLLHALEYLNAPCVGIPVVDIEDMCVWAAGFQLSLKFGTVRVVTGASVGDFV
jgi:hypothetical protein